MIHLKLKSIDSLTPKTLAFRSDSKTDVEKGLVAKKGSIMGIFFLMKLGLDGDQDSFFVNILNVGDKY